MKKIRCSVVLKAHSPLLWLHPLSTAPSNGAQFPGAISEAGQNVIGEEQGMCKGQKRTCKGQCAWNEMETGPSFLRFLLTG